MKNLIYALLGLMMMFPVSFNAWASNVGPSTREHVTVSQDIGLPDSQCFTCVAQSVQKVVFMATGSPDISGIVKHMAIRERQIDVPVCPFRYLGRSKNCIAHGNLISSNYNDNKRLHKTKVSDIRHKPVGGGHTGYLPERECERKG